LLAAIDKGQAFNNPKEFAVWLGLTPKQHASDNISKMGSITKRGDRYLRRQHVHGARALVSRAAKSTTPLFLWATNFALLNRLTKWPSPWPTALPSSYGYYLRVRKAIALCLFL
jgi:transposase